MAYFTASCDAPDVNQKFAESLDLDYPILSDPSRATALAYGLVETSKGSPKRWTIYVGKDGRILHIDKSVNARTHGPDIAKKLQELGVAKRG